MNALTSFISGPSGQHLAASLLHTLWQGAILAGLLWALLKRIPADRPNARYLISFAGLFSIVLGGILTWSALDTDWSPDKKSSAVASGEKNEAFSTKTGIKTAERAARAEKTSSETKLSNSASLPDVQTGVETPSDVDAARRAFAWTPVLLSVWFCGVVAMLFRAAWIVAAARQSFCGPEILDGVLKTLVEELQKTFGIGRTIRLVEGAAEIGPAVFGFFSPVLTLPVAVLAELPHDCVRAILAHELAHIARCDYFWNLVQMAIEAGLFFNPAVWWISRRIRIEREACCDFSAAKLLGQPPLLAEALAVWAEKARAADAAVAEGCPQVPCAEEPNGTRSVPATLAAMQWYDKHDITSTGVASGTPKPLLDRVKRLVLPGYRPATPISFVGLAGMIFLGVLGLALLRGGTSMAMEVAAQILTPAERMEKLETVRKEYGNGEESNSVWNDTNKSATLSGTIRTFDGKPLPRRVFGYLREMHSGGGGISSVSISSSFSYEIHAGRIWLLVQSDDYAPAVTGPYFAKRGETIPNIDIVLESGFSLPVSIKDPDGHPVKEAELSCWPYFDNAGNGRSDLKYVSDANGTVLVPHINRGSYQFSVKKPGFQPQTTQHDVVDAEHPIELAITPAKSVKGVVVSPNGTPVAGATVAVIYRSSPKGDCQFGIPGNTLTTTDEDGNFTLGELEDDSSYLLRVDGKEQGQAVVKDVVAGQKDLRIELGPRLVITGVIKGDLDQLEKYNGKPLLRYSQEIHPHSSSGSSVFVEEINGEHRFTLDRLLPGDVTLEVNRRIIHVTVDSSHPREDISIDLTKYGMEKRHVVIQFSTPDGSVPPRGEVEVTIGVHNGTGEMRYYAIKDGKVEFDAIAPGFVQPSPKGMIGYWFKYIPSRNIERGEEPVVIDVPVFPAGAISGRILSREGEPVSGKSYYCHATPDPELGFLFNSDYSLEQSIPTEEGKIFFTPLKLGGPYCVVVHHGNTIQVSKTVTPNAMQPVANVEVRMPKTVAVSGSIADPDGNPLPKIDYSLAYYKGNNSYASWVDPGTFLTDDKGRFHLEGINADTGDTYLVVKSIKDFKPIRTKLPKEGTPVTIKLKRGSILEGQILDDKTGWPVPGVEVFAMPKDFSSNSFSYEPERPTDQNGRFRFSNLADQNTYYIGMRNVSNAARIMTYVAPGEKDLVLRVIIPEGSKIEPRQPEEK